MGWGFRDSEEETLPAVQFYLQPLQQFVSGIPNAPLGTVLEEVQQHGRLSKLSTLKPQTQTLNPRVKNSDAT